MNIVQELEKEQVEKLAAEREVPEFGPGDTLRVDVKVVEGTRERIQAFEGVCIARRNAGLNSSFTVRKISYGEGVERVFPLYSRASPRSPWSAGAASAAPSSTTCAAAPVSPRVSPRRRPRRRKRPPPRPARRPEPLNSLALQSENPAPNWGRVFLCPFVEVWR